MVETKIQSFVYSTLPGTEQELLVVEVLGSDMVLALAELKTW
jgi:hypothetical protein